MTFQLQIRKNFPFLSVLAVAVSATGCGNSWTDSGDRKETPAALMVEADKAYDQEKYDKAAELYEKVFSLDPAADTAKIRAAYSFLGTVGLTVFKLFEDFSSTTTATSGSSATSGLDKVIGVVGLNTAQKQAVIDATTADKTVARDPQKFRAASTKLQKLQRGWKALCAVLPTATLDAAVAGDEKYKTYYSSDSCTQRGNLTVARDSALLAAAVITMSEAASFYQVAFDADGNGELDFVTSSTTIQTKITSAQAKAAVQATAMQGLTDLNEALGALTDLSASVESDLVSLTDRHFEVVSSLIASIPEIDSSVKDSINKGVTAFRDARKVFLAFSKSYSAGAVSASGQSQRTSLENRVGQIGSNIDTAIANEQARINALSGAEKAAAQAQLEQQTTTSCSNFDAVKTAYGLPASLQKPASCGT